MKLHSGTVWHGDRCVGQLRANRRGALQFHYDSEWLDRGFPVSLALPLSIGDRWIEAHGFFAGLLPEGRSRERICRRLRIDPDDDATLIFAIGEDCAGALSIVPSDPPPGEDRQAAQPIDREELEGLIRARGAGQIGSSPQRFSLAGVQDKLPVVIRSDAWYPPSRGQPSTHLVKFETIAHVCLAEFLATRVAQALGLEVVDLELHWLEGEEPVPWLLISRYDRSADEDGARTRLHQEDVLQALGYEPSLKYEEDGGPALADVAVLLRRHAAQPVHSVRRLVDWLVFNWLIGNFDGHAKNVSLLYPPGSAVPRLAPFYDLVAIDFLNQVSHAPYARTMAFAIGGEYTPERIGRAAWSAFAGEIGIRASWITRRLGELTEALPQAAESAREQATTILGDHPLLERFAHHVVKRARWASSVAS